MLPVSEDELLTGDFEEGEPETSLSYRLQEGRISGYVDGTDAVRQAIELIFATERFAYSIYSSNYGIELQELFGLNPGLLYARLTSRIEEALLADDRILELGDFNFEARDGRVCISFTVKTIYGELMENREIDIYGSNAESPE